MEIPDFAISPPVEITLPATTVDPVRRPERRRSRATTSSTARSRSRLRGDARRGRGGTSRVRHPPGPVGHAAGRRRHDRADLVAERVRAGEERHGRPRSTTCRRHAIPPGIYTVWIEGESGNPYYQRRQVPVPVRVQTDGNNDGDYNDAVDVKVTRDFSLDQLGPRRLDRRPRRDDQPPAARSRPATARRNWGSGPAAETNVALSWDTDSLTTCSLAPASLGMGIDRVQLHVGDAHHRDRRPLSTLTINTVRPRPGLLPVHDPRATASNSDGQPVTHLADRSASPWRPRRAAASTSTSSASPSSRSTPSARTTSSATP